MTYLLIASVMGLWGLIFYRVAYNVSAEPVRLGDSNTKDSVTFEKVFSVKDTFTL